ncbi:uncharacterized protein LOC100182234 isoform X1 [Ciona intestinalis]
MSVALSMTNSTEPMLHSASNIPLPSCTDATVTVNVEAQNGSLNEACNIESTNIQSVEPINEENKVLRKKLSRGKSLNYDEMCDKQELVHDESVFPSPFVITQEEALRETYPLLARQNNRYHFASPGGGNDENGERQKLNNDVLEHSYEGHVTQRPTLRRESDKPPRLQKQASKDRLTPSSGRLSHTHSFDSNGGESTGSLSKHSSTECLDSMGVDVHEFLVKALQGNSRDRSILLKLEHDMVQFVSNSEIAFMKFPEMTSYHRMLVHRVAAYFGLDHNIDAKGKSVIINKTAYTRMPEKKFSDYSYHGEICSSRDEDMRRRSILKRMKNCQSFEHFKSEPHKSWKMMKQRSFEEREVNYEKIRARIFNEAEQLNDGSFDKSQVGDFWSRKQWDGTEQSSSRDNSSSPLPPSDDTSSSLRPKPGITVLSRRHNPEFNGSTSPSSSTSSTNQFVANEISNEHLNGGTHAPSYQGAPYVTVDGQPLLYPSKPLMVPTYPTPPFPVQMGYQPLHRPNKFYPTHYPSHRPPYANNHCFMRQDSRESLMSHPRNGYSNVQQMTETSEGNYPQPQYYPPTYQPAPVQLVYYPNPVQVVPVGQNNQLALSEDDKENINSKMNELNITESQTKVVSDEANLSQINKASATNEASNNVNKSSLNQNDDANEISLDAKELNISDAITVMPDSSVADLQSTKSIVETDEVPNISTVATTSANVVTTIHAGPGSITYYTPNTLTASINTSHHPSGVVGPPVIPPKPTPGFWECYPKH